MFFETYLLNSYNKIFAQDILIDCQCYKKYGDEESFIKNIIENRQSYMTCICYESLVRNRVGHCSVPIILGSYIDFRIRGAKAVIESRAQWGLVILRGLLKIYASFSTFDALSMHVRETKNNKTIDWFTYVGEDGLALSYSNKIVTWTYQRRTNNSINSNEWVRLLAQSNPFKTTVLASEYIKMFDTILKYQYSMNDLKIRQIINGPTIIKKYVVHDLNRRKKKKTAGCQKMSTAFETGSLFQALSKKNTYETEEWCRNYPQNYDNTMHEGRSNKTAHFLPNITRASNAAVRNSNALTFPTDAVHYYCMLNTKDLKSAGEQNVLADYVIMTEETDQMELFNYLKSISTEIGGEILTINGYLINCRRSWCLQDLIMVKSHFPHVTTQYHLPYVKFSTRACIPIKYSEEYDSFFSPAETTHFNITYPESDMLSITAKELDLNCLRKTPPAKSTVSINNIKGSVAKVTSPLHRMLMENSLGVTCYMNITSEEIDRLIDYAIISYNNDTSFYKEAYDELVKEFNLDIDRLRKPKTTNSGKAMKALLRLYPPQELLVECKKQPNSPFIKEKCIESKNKVSEYTSIIYNGRYFKSPDIWNLKLRAAFGNPFGACIEDGVVIDSEILKHIPPIYYNACITVEFTFKTVKQPKDAKFIPIDETNGSIPHETLIGCLISEHEAYVKNSKHTKILTTKIGDHYYYLVHFLPKKTKMYDNLKIRHINNNTSITIVITGQNEARVGIGSKVANAFGQKNVISIATDKLKDTCWGITADGRKVHAQLIYSEVSLIGRIPSGQLYSMFTSNELAIGPNKTFIAPVDLVIHTLHPYTNIKVFDVRVDTLTNINGFDSQNLSNTSSYLRSEKVDAKVLQVLGLHGYNIDLKSGSQDIPIIVQEEEEESSNLHDGGAGYNNNNNNINNLKSQPPILVVEEEKSSNLHAGYNNINDLKSQSPILVEKLLDTNNTDIPIISSQNRNLFENTTPVKSFSTKRSALDEEEAAAVAAGGEGGGDRKRMKIDIQI